MAPKVVTIFPCATVSALLVLVSCSARTPIAPAYAPFRLEAVRGEDSLLFTPAIPQANTGHAPITLLLKSTNAPSSLRCFAERGYFRLKQAENDPRSVQITIPSPETWLDDLEGRLGNRSDDGTEALFEILGDLDKLEDQGCFSHTKVSIRDLILESLPMKPGDSLFNLYGYLAGRSGLDLKAGLRLKMERAYFRAAEPGEQEHAPKLFLGVSTAYFNVLLSSGGKLRFRQHGTITYKPPSLIHRVHDENSDLGLSSIPEESHFRLIFKTYLVPQEHSRSAAILGAKKSSQLDELDEELRRHPDEDCKAVAARYQAICFGFEGFVTLTPQIKVELNGKDKFIDSGTRIKELLSNTNAETLKSLRVQRKFMNSYYDLRFDSADSNVLSVALVGRDRVSWSSGSATPR